MRYIVYIFILFFVGCSSNIEQLQKDDRHDDILIKASSCAPSLEEAKKQALLKLSNNLYSNVQSEQNSNKLYVKNNRGIKYNNSMAYNFNIKSSLLVITPKFIDVNKKTALFKDDEYCATVIIDKILAKRYLNLMKKDFEYIKKDVKANVEKNSFIIKDYIIQKVLDKDREYVREYKKLHHVVRILGIDNSSLPLDMSVTYLSSIVNAKPYVKIIILNKNFSYKQIFKFKLKIKDENPNNLKIQWFVNGRLVDTNTTNIAIKNNKLQNINLKVIVTDDKGDSTTKETVVKLVNKAPNACFMAKATYYTNERLKFKSCARDPENDFLKIRYRLEDLNIKKGIPIRNKRKFKRVGVYKVIQTVTDRYGKTLHSYKTIHIENRFINKLSRNMLDSQVINKIGFPTKKERIEYHLIGKNDEAFKYGNYWLLFETGMLKCAVYNYIYESGWHCNDYKRRKYKILDLSDSLAFN